MTERVITPRSRGFLFLDSHPAGCARLVEDMWRAVPATLATPATTGPSDGSPSPGGVETFTPRRVVPVPCAGPHAARPPRCR
ncbi:hypothetical protein [Streptomyces sp. NPDC055036]